MAEGTLEDLKTFAKSGAFGFIKFEDGGLPIEGLYLGFEVEEDTFNPGQKRIAYKLEIAGENKTLASGSKRLAQAIIDANPTVGSFIRITRLGEGFDTQYTAETSEIPF